ncbi:hypothetical protein KIPB_010576, partial [Kipferlia bialata]
ADADGFDAMLTTEVDTPMVTKAKAATAPIPIPGSTPIDSPAPSAQPSQLHHSETGDVSPSPSAGLPGSPTPSNPIFTETPTETDAEREEQQRLHALRRWVQSNKSFRSSDSLASSQDTGVAGQSKGKFTTKCPFCRREATVRRFMTAFHLLAALPAPLSLPEVEARGLDDSSAASLARHVNLASHGLTKYDVLFSKKRYTVQAMLLSSVLDLADTLPILPASLKV